MQMFLAIVFQIDDVVDDGTKVDPDMDDASLYYVLDTTMYLPYHGPLLVCDDVFYPLKDSFDCAAVVEHTAVNVPDNYLTIESEVAYDSVDKATFLVWYHELRARGWLFEEELLERHVTPARQQGNIELPYQRVSPQLMASPVEAERQIVTHASIKGSD